VPTLLLKQRNVDKGSAVVPQNILSDKINSVGGSDECIPIVQNNSQKGFTKHWRQSKVFLMLEPTEP